MRVEADGPTPRRRKTRAFALAAIALVALAVGVVVDETGTFGSIEDESVDARMSLRGKPQATDRVAVVELDEASTARLGQPPVKRDVTARVVRTIKRDGATAIALDFLYVEPTGPANSEFVSREDEALFDALDAARPVVLADTAVSDLRPFEWVAPLAEVGAAVGDVGWGPPGGDEFRRVPRELDGLETLPVVAVEAGRGAAVGGDGFDDGEAVIDYPSGIPVYSYLDVLDGRVPRGAFRDRIVFVGDGTDASNDRHPTPVDDDFVAGVEINAAAADTLLRDVPVRDAPGWLAILFIGLCAAVGPAAGLRRSTGLVVGLAFLGALLALVVAQLAFAAGLVLPLVAALVALVVGAALAFGLLHLLALRDRRRLRTAVERFLPREAADRALESAGWSTTTRRGRLGLRRARAETEGGGDSSAEPTLPTGSVVGGYEIASVLGRGGMGVVYEATQTTLERRVALKVLAPHLTTNDELRRRFRREALLQATVDHPNVVDVLDAGEDPTGLYIAMRLVRGPNLRRLIASGGLDDERTVKLLTPIAAALDAAHERELVHRDVKPSNILVDRDDHPYLADFGLVTMAEASKITRSGVFMGSVDYVSPEQILGEEIGPAADVYAFAAVLFECLCGHPPFLAATAPAVVYAHLERSPPKVTATRPELPDGLDGLLAAGLAKKARSRPASASALIAAVALVFEQSRPDGPGKPEVRPSRPDDATSAPNTGVDGADDATARDAPRR